MAAHTATTVVLPQSIEVVQYWVYETNKTRVMMNTTAFITVKVEQPFWILRVFLTLKTFFQTFQFKWNTPSVVSV